MYGGRTRRSVSSPALAIRMPVKIKKRLLFIGNAFSFVFIARAGLEPAASGL